jgi:hypothetical protein
MVQLTSDAKEIKKKPMILEKVALKGRSEGFTARFGLGW